MQLDRDQFSVMWLVEIMSRPISIRSRSMVRVLTQTANLRPHHPFPQQLPWISDVEKSRSMSNSMSHRNYFNNHSKLADAFWVRFNPSLGSTVKRIYYRMAMRSSISNTNFWALLKWFNRTQRCLKTYNCWSTTEDYGIPSIHDGGLSNGVQLSIAGVFDAFLESFLPGV